MSSQPGSSRPRPLKSVLAFTLKAALIFAVLTSLGCWSRLTTPKESFLYELGGSARVFNAPEYQEKLAEIERKHGPDLYRVVIGSRVSIEIYGHGIKQTLNIRPDGKVDLPLVAAACMCGSNVLSFVWFCRVV